MCGLASVDPGRSFTIERRQACPASESLSIAFHYHVGGRIHIHIEEILNFGCRKILRLNPRVLASLSWLRDVITSGSCNLVHAPEA